MTRVVTGYDGMKIVEIDSIPILTDMDVGHYVPTYSKPAHWIRCVIDDEEFQIITSGTGTKTSVCLVRQGVPIDTKKFKARTAGEKNSLIARCAKKLIAEANNPSLRPRWWRRRIYINRHKPVSVMS